MELKRLVVLSSLGLTLFSPPSGAVQVTNSEALVVLDVFRAADLVELGGMATDYVRIDDIACSFAPVDVLPNGIDVDVTPACAGFKGGEEIVITGFDASSLSHLVERYGRRANVGGVSIARASSVELRVDGFSSKVEASID